MRQGKTQPFTVPNIGTSLPSGAQGLAMSSFGNGGRRPAKYLLEITVTGGSPVVTPVGSSTALGTAWGPLGDDDAFNGGNAITGTRFFEMENIGTLERFGLLLSAGTATAILTGILENGD